MSVVVTVVAIVFGLSFTAYWIWRSQEEKKDIREQHQKELDRLDDQLKRGDIKSSEYEKLKRDIDDRYGEQLRKA